MANNDDFKLKENNTPQVDDGFTKDDFKFVQADKKIHDQKFETKPTTFLKDCLRRFAKNKSSVVAAFILGFLLLLSVIIPVACKANVVHETNVSHPDIKYLEPKLFPAGTGFWDGTKKLTGIPVDTSNPDKSKWAPDPKDYAPNAIISELELGDENYTKTATKFGKDGFVQFGYYSTMPDADPETHKNEYIKYGAFNKIPEYNFEDSLKITTFDVYDEARLANSDEKTKTFPDGYVEAESALFISFEKDENPYEVQLTDYKTAHTVGLSCGDAVIDVNAKFNEFATEKGFVDKLVNKLVVEVRVKNSNNHKNSCALVRSVQISSSSTTPIALTPSKDHVEENFPKTVGELFNSISFVNGTKALIRYSDMSGYWMNYSNTDYSRVSIYLSKAVLCSFTYDTYEAALGKLDVFVEYGDIKDYKNFEWLDFTILPKKGADGKYYADPLTFKCKILNPDKCPLATEFTAEDVVFMDEGASPVIKGVNTKVFKYKANYQLGSMPLFLLGTDQSGRDMLIYVFEGLRTSLLLGVATTIICFLFGLLWGSISGYFGGAVDLVMERFTDILSGIPWVVVMTLSIIKFRAAFSAADQIPTALSVFILGFSICITGWIGTAATTRTQFYRFRGREYVLASRTLGASHGRLIRKHILPNAMGTIITSAVLMVPSVIFSEATISYLGLGFKDIASLGVILSDNQVELTNHPYLLIFPSIIIALIMISFNLFGNGLRDAVNPSLKGEGE